MNQFSKLQCLQMSPKGGLARFRSLLGFFLDHTYKQTRTLKNTELCYQSFILPALNTLCKRWWGGRSITKHYQCCIILCDWLYDQGRYIGSRPLTFELISTALRRAPWLFFWTSVYTPSLVRQESGWQCEDNTCNNGFINSKEVKGEN